MSVYSNTRNALGLAAAAAALTACSGAATSAGAPGFVPSTRGASTGPSAEMPIPKSWMDAGAAQLKRLLYVSDGSADAVLVYDYETGKQVGELLGFQGPAGHCVDASGNVWIANNGAQTLVEYARGTVSQIKTVEAPGNPVGCAVAPDGDLAAASNPLWGHDEAATITVWHNGIQEPAPQMAPDTCAQIASPGYDDRGNLYVECTLGGDLARIYELAKGSDNMLRVQTNFGFAAPASVMWDGKYLAFTGLDETSRGGTEIVRAVASAANGLTSVGTTRLSSACEDAQPNVPQPFIVGNVNTPANHEQGTAVVGADYLCGNVFQWAYPAGAMTKLLISAPAHITGASVSIATIPPPGK